MDSRIQAGWSGQARAETICRRSPPPRRRTRPRPRSHRVPAPGYSASRPRPGPGARDLDAVECLVADVAGVGSDGHIRRRQPAPEGQRVSGRVVHQQQPAGRMMLKPFPDPSLCGACPPGQLRRSRPTVPVQAQPLTQVHGKLQPRSRHGTATRPPPPPDRPDRAARPGRHPSPCSSSYSRPAAAGRTHRPQMMGDAPPLATNMRQDHHTTPAHRLAGWQNTLICAAVRPR
jgi:hypothetical protein